jgi:hypothetical protein
MWTSQASHESPWCYHVIRRADAGDADRSNINEVSLEIEHTRQLGHPGKGPQLVHSSWLISSQISVTDTLMHEAVRLDHC